MKTISFANSKGGSGKTTSAALLGTGLIAQGASVALLDCDPLFPLYHWGQGAVSDHAFVTRTTECGKLLAEINRLKRQFDYCVVDLSGASAQMKALAFALSDLVLVPMQGSAMDARGAVDTIDLINIVAEKGQTKVQTCVLLTRINPLVVTNAVKHAVRVVNTLEVPLFRTPIIERSAYRDMFTSAEDLLRTEHQDISNLAKARQDVVTFADAVLSLLQTGNSKTVSRRHLAAI